MIDARKKLNSSYILKFFETADNDSIISVKATTNPAIGFATTKKEFVEMLLKTRDLKDEDEIVCSFDDVEMIFTGYDVLWYQKTTRRTNKLLNEVNEKMSIVLPEQPVYCAGVATLIDNKLSQICVYNGTKSDVIEKINNDINTRLIDSFLKAKIVIDLAYKDEDREDVTQWLTIDELVEIGAIVLK